MEPPHFSTVGTAYHSTGAQVCSEMSGASVPVTSMTSAGHALLPPFYGEAGSKRGEALGTGPRLLFSVSVTVPETLTARSEREVPSSS